MSPLLKGRDPIAAGRRARPTWPAWIAILVIADVALVGLLAIRGFAPKEPRAAEAHQLTTVAATSPSAAGVFDALERDGLAAALEALKRAAGADSAVLRDAHRLAHALGRRALVANGGNASVIGQCRPIFASGCYHGVVEAFLNARGNVDMQELERMCVAAGSDERPGPIYECVHGLGHGVLGALSLDLRGTLRHCDALTNEDMRRWCHSGAFMEATNAALADSGGHPAHHGSHEGAGHAEHGAAAIASGRLALDRANPYSPCDAFDGPHAAACWVYQAFLVLQNHDFDAAAAFRTCDDAPHGRAADCYQGVGLQLSGLFQRDDAWVLEQCATGRPDLAAHCAGGAALTLAAMDWSGARAGGLCAASPRSWKAACYRNTGRALTGLASASERAAFCTRIEPGYADTCREAAALGPAGAGRDLTVTAP